jgi:hypothetical protein
LAVKTDTFTAPGLLVVRQWDRWNGALFIAWKPSVSMAFRARKELLKFVAWPAKTPTGDRFRDWLNSFEEPAAAEAPPAQPLSPELLATGFGPECHLDESDPNYNTRTVI